METSSKDKIGSSTERQARITTADTLEHIVKFVEVERGESEFSSTDSLFSFLRRWWSNKYSRPYRDPLLMEYSLEELYYEFLDQTYDDRMKNKDTEATSDSPTKEDYKWAEEMEDLEISNKTQSNQETKPNQDPDNIEYRDDIIASFD